MAGKKKTSRQIRIAKKYAQRYLRKRIIEELRTKSAEYVNLERLQSNDDWFKNIALEVLHEKAQRYLHTLSDDQLAELLDKIGTHPWPANAVWVEQDKRRRKKPIDELRAKSAEQISIEISQSDDDSFKRIALTVLKEKANQFLSTHSDEQLLGLLKMAKTDPWLANAVVKEQEKRRRAEIKGIQEPILRLSIKQIEHLVLASPPTYSAKQVAYANELLLKIRDLRESLHEIQSEDLLLFASSVKSIDLPRSIVKKVMQERWPELYVAMRNGRWRAFFKTKVEDGMDDDFLRPRWC